jgi:IS1 family transposase
MPDRSSTMVTLKEVGMNKLSLKDRARILACLVEGNSIRATVRMTGAAKNTVVKLLADVGTACAEYQDKTLRKLPCKRLQCDEIWSFVYAKQKNVKTAKTPPEGAGDAWTWTALDADTKLIAGWFIGPRDADAAYEFMTDLASRLSSRVQLTTDSHQAYLTAVEEGFGAGVDYAQLVKIYGSEATRSPERRYSPLNFCGTKVKTITGDPDPRHISTSYVERQNLTMRMGMRRFTRLTNGFSKKLENLGHAVALHFMHYNFARIHQTLRVTPAMEAGVSDHLWSIEEIAALADEKSL